MKNISLALNIVLIIAVALLYYKVYSGKTTESPATSDSTAVSAPVVPLSAQSLAELPKGVPFAFINADTIFSHYEFAKKAKASGEARVSNYQRTYQQKVESFQKEYDEYVQKAGAGGYTKEQGMAIEAGLMKKKDEIMAMEQNQDKVMAELDNSTVEVQTKIYDYLRRFNQEHGYACVMAFTLNGGGALGVNDSLDVTRQVLEGLNAEYKASSK